MMSLELLPPLRHGETALFAVTAGALMWMYKKGPPKVTLVEVSNVTDRYQISLLSYQVSMSVSNANLFSTL